MTGETVQNKYITLVLLSGIASFVGLVSWMTVYLVTAVPGTKLVNGMICGLAEDQPVSLSAIYLNGSVMLEAPSS